MYHPSLQQKGATGGPTRPPSSASHKKQKWKQTTTTKKWSYIIQAHSNQCLISRFLWNIFFLPSLPPPCGMMVLFLGWIVGCPHMCVCPRVCFEGKQKRIETFIHWAIHVVIQKKTLHFPSFCGGLATVYREDDENVPLLQLLALRQTHLVATATALGLLLSISYIYKGKKSGFFNCVLSCFGFSMFGSKSRLKLDRQKLSVKRTDTGIQCQGFLHPLTKFLFHWIATIFQSVSILLVIHKWISKQKLKLTAI